MQVTDKFTEEVEVLATLPPTDAKAAVATHATAWIKAGSYHRFFVLLNIGEAGVNATLDAAIWEASDNAGTGAQLITGKAITQIVVADEGGIVGIELRADELDSAIGEYIQVRVIVGTATYHYACTVMGTVLRYMPADDSIFTEVVE